MSVYVFSSPTCEPCKRLKPVFEDLKEEFSTLQWIDVNIKEKPELAAKYNIKFVPAVTVVSINRTESHFGESIMGYYRILRNATQESL
jgi:thioredoxin 1